MFNDTQILGEFRGPWGVPIQIGASILILPLIFIDFTGTPRTLAYDLMFLAILVGSIYLHELGHAWGNLIQAVPVKRIMLYGGGGFCEASRSATRRERELIVAMGPIVNLVLWAVASLLANWVADPEIGYIFWAVAYINGFLAVLNLLPVQPLDGGKLFELALHRILAPATATRIAGAVGLVLCLIWIPAMAFSWWAFGLVLFFLPSIRIHWQMVRLRHA